MHLDVQSLAQNLFSTAKLGPLVPVAPSGNVASSRTDALSKSIGRGLALCVIALGVALASPGRASSQGVTLPINLPVDNTLPYRPDEILISTPGRSPVLRGELRTVPVAKSARKRAQPLKHLELRWTTDFLSDSPQLLSEFLRPVGPADLWTAINPDSVIDVEAWRRDVLAEEIDGAKRTAEHDLCPSLKFNPASDHSESLREQGMVIICPQDVVDRFDLSSLELQSESGPPSMTLRAVNFRPSWSALREIEESSHERDAQPSIPVFTTIEPTRLLQVLPQDAPQRTSRAASRRR